MLEVIHQIFGNFLQSVGVAYNGFQACPFCPHLLAVAQFFAFGEFFKLFVKTYFFVFVKMDFCQTAFIENRNGGFVVYGLLNVVNVHIVTENGLGVFVGGFNGRTCETYKRGIG
ncbi:MAG: hypothetical protein FMNOHCHN_03816 [Ignavibacteriaceae bacterium]|nr:hypothetical protein [Ignavibacteriaceae bacterium]